MLASAEVPPMNRASLDRCPVCLTGKTEKFAETNNLTTHQPTDILRCSDCRALINVSAFKALWSDPAKDHQTVSFYSFDKTSRDEHESCIRAYRSVIDYLASQIDLAGRETFLDFGGGFGYAAFAASARFQRVIVCDSHPHLADAVRTLFANEYPNVVVVNDIENVSTRADVLFMWHVLEHLPEPTKMWRSLSHYLNPKCAIFVQIPEYDPRYVVDSHFIFYSEPSLRAWASAIGAYPIHFAPDTTLHFLSMIAVKR